MGPPAPLLLSIAEAAPALERDLLTPPGGIDCPVLVALALLPGRAMPPTPPPPPLPALMPRITSLREE